MPPARPTRQTQWLRGHRRNALTGKGPPSRSGGAAYDGVRLALTLSRRSMSRVASWVAIRRGAFKTKCPVPVAARIPSASATLETVTCLHCDDGAPGIHAAEALGQTERHDSELAE